MRNPLIKKKGELVISSIEENNNTSLITIPQNALLPVPAKKNKGYHPKARTHETVEQRKWFMEYVKLGSSHRSLEKIIAMSGRHPHTIAKWSSRWKWVERTAVEDQKLLDIGDGLDTHAINSKRKKLVLDLADYLIKHAAIIDEETGEVTGAKINIKNVFDLRAVIDIRDEQLGLKDKNKAIGSGTTNIDKAVFIIKK